MTALVLPMQPTPNGPMHIGHAAGTYLRADIVARALRSRGVDARLLCGPDSFESWVAAAALQSGLRPQDEARRRSLQIERELRDFGIAFDEWLDPLQQETRVAMESFHEATMAECLARGLARELSEKVPFALETGEPLIGPWLAGLCPSCGAEAQGNSCTVCNAHFPPHQIVNPRPRLGTGGVELREARFVSLPVPVGTAVSSPAFSGEAERVANEYLRTQSEFRLSSLGEWGMRSDLLGEGAVLANPYYLYCGYLAERDAETHGLYPPGLHPLSTVAVVGVFGSDNIVPGLAIPALLSKALPDRYTPFTDVVVNGMLDLDGHKCSTSKRHGIWMRPLADAAVVETDELRGCLAEIPLESRRCNVTAEDLSALVNRLRRRVQEWFAAAATMPRGAAIPDGDRLARQAAMLEPRGLCLSEAMGEVWSGMAAPGTLDGHLATMAALTEAVMPTFSSQVEAARAALRAGLPGRDVLHRLEREVETTSVRIGQPITPSAFRGKVREFPDGTAR